MNIASSIVEVHIFRIIKGELEFLLLKRSEDDQTYPGLWQMVTGSIHENEKAYKAAFRELTEETGLSPQKFWIVPNVNSFYSSSKDEIHLVPVFAALVDADSVVKLSSEHSHYIWVKSEEAQLKLAWDGQKRSVEIISNYYLNQKNNFDLLEVRNEE
ncbi:MAG: NUDIX pyrophosphatase [Bacteroidota bacterium]